MAAEAYGDSMAEKIEGGGEWCTGDRLLVMKGADDDGIGCEGNFLQRFEGAFYPGVEVGSVAVFEFQQTAGDLVFSGG